LEGVSVNDAKLDRKRDIESLIRGEEKNQIDVETGWGEGEVIPCNLAFRRIHKDPLAFLLSVRVAGPVQKPGQRTLF
jgi:hypothetical protein